MMEKSIENMVIGLMAIVLASCMFTGVEHTPKITDKEVGNIVKVTTEDIKAQAMIDFEEQPFGEWLAGKRFYVSDDNIKRIFSTNQAYNNDTLHLEGKYLTYMGYTTGSVLDNRNTVNIRFSDGKNSYEYRTDKEIAELGENFEVPFLIDMDLVQLVRSKLKGQSYYIRTSSWLNSKGEQIRGRRYVKVEIDEVMPGNKVYPLMLRFRDVEKNAYAYLWMTVGKTAIKNRSFDALFSLSDIRQKYSHISDDVWECIVEGRVKREMTKEECKLAWGSPKAMRQVPGYDGVREFWDYENGHQLRFDDGLLEGIR